MGYYIETPESNKGKAGIIAKKYDGKLVGQEEAKVAMADKSEAVIIVVDNGLFEAAAFAYDMKEFEVFIDPRDNRIKRFVIIDRVKAKELTRFKGE